MPDTASLSFDIDSSQAQRAISVLETLKASSIAMTQTANQQNTSSATLSQTYDQQRDALNKLAQATKSYDGTLQGLAAKLEDTRRAMNSSQVAINAYASTLVQATSAATALNASVAGLDRYIDRARQLNIASTDLATGLERITAALKKMNVPSSSWMSGADPERP